MPDCFGEMTLIAKRTFPHFLLKKWDLERDEEYVGNPLTKINKVRDPIPSQDRDRQAIDQESASFGLSLVTKRSLSQLKLNNNSRIVVVGASDTGISFIEYLLSLRYVNFPNLVLVNPGGLIYADLPNDDPYHMLKAQR